MHNRIRAGSHGTPSLRLNHVHAHVMMLLAAAIDHINIVISPITTSTRTAVKLPLLALWAASMVRSCAITLHSCMHQCAVVRAYINVHMMLCPSFIYLVIENDTRTYACMHAYWLRAPMHAFVTHVMPPHQYSRDMARSKLFGNPTFRLQMADTLWDQGGRASRVCGAVALLIY